MSVMDDIFQRAVELYGGPDFDTDGFANTVSAVWIDAVYEALEGKTNAQAYVILGGLVEDDWYMSVVNWSEALAPNDNSLADFLIGTMTNGQEATFEARLKTMLPADHEEIDARREMAADAYARSAPASN